MTARNDRSAGRPIRQIFARVLRKLRVFLLAASVAAVLSSCASSNVGPASDRFASGMSAVPANHLTGLGAPVENFASSEFSVVSDVDGLADVLDDQITYGTSVDDALVRVESVLPADARRVGSNTQVYCEQVLYRSEAMGQQAHFDDGRKISMALVTLITGDGDTGQVDTFDPSNVKYVTVNGGDDDLANQSAYGQECPA